jgi:hypothetical protein
MIVMLRLNHPSISILEKSHFFFIQIGEKLLESPFPSYRAAYDWAERLTKNCFRRKDDEER